MELRLPLEVSPGREATCRAVFGTWGSFPDDARASHCPFVLTSFTGWSSERCPGIGFLPRGDREIGVLRNVEAPTRPRLEYRRETGLILRCDRKVGNPFQTKQGSRPSCRDQEGRRGSEEVVPENLGVPLQGARDDGGTTEAPSLAGCATANRCRWSAARTSTTSSTLPGTFVPGWFISRAHS